MSARVKHWEEWDTNLRHRKLSTLTPRQRQNDLRELVIGNLEYKLDQYDHSASCQPCGRCNMLQFWTPNQFTFAKIRRFMEVDEALT